LKLDVPRDSLAGIGELDGVNLVGVRRCGTTCVQGMRWSVVVRIIAAARL